MFWMWWMKKKTIYNLESQERFEDAKIINGNPSGIINFNRTPHQWANSTYRLMEANQWFVEEVNVSQDKIPYKALSEPEKYMYDMCVAQLITNDSIQVNQLMDSINQYITSPVVNAALALQTYQEANHGRSYAVMVEEICEDTDRIYNLHKYEPALTRKNRAVADMYSQVNSDTVNEQEFLVALAANQVLEELVFPGGFVAIWSLGGKMPGSAKDISFISRDEDTHVALFRNIFRTTEKQVTLHQETEYRIKNMIMHMCNEEKIWTKHITKGNLGFSDKAIDLFIEHKANSVFSNLNIESPYQKTDGGPLMSIVDRYSMNGTKNKSNFFEVPVGDYAINSIDDDY